MDSYKMRLLKTLEQHFAKLKSKTLVNKKEKVALPKAGQSLPTMPQIGLRGYDRDPKGKVTCFVCKTNIEKGLMRFSYRFRSSSTPRDQQFMHAACWADFIRSGAWSAWKTREADRKALQTWLDQAPLGDLRNALQTAVDSLAAL